jgi:hypothetical protein
MRLKGWDVDPTGWPDMGTVSAIKTWACKVAPGARVHVVDDARALEVDESLLRLLCGHLGVDPLHVGLERAAEDDPPKPKAAGQTPAQREAFTALWDGWLRHEMARLNLIGTRSPNAEQVREILVPTWLHAVLVAVLNRPALLGHSVRAHAEPEIVVVWAPDPYGMRVARAVLDAAAGGEPDVEAVVRSVPKLL